MLNKNWPLHWVWWCTPVTLTHWRLRQRESRVQSQCGCHPVSNSQHHGRTRSRGSRIYNSSSHPGAKSCDWPCNNCFSAHMLFEVFVSSWEGEAYWAPPPPMVLHSYWLIERGIGRSSHGVAIGPRNNPNGIHYITKKQNKKSWM